MGIFDFRICFKRFQNTVKKNYSFFVEQCKKDGNNLPNRITELRLLFSIIVGLLLIFSFDSKFLQWVVFILFLLVTATDGLDGYFARRLNEVTELGKILDPVADKILMFMVLTVLFFHGELQLIIAIIIGCELTVFLVNIIRVKGIPVNWIGKIRMAVQCFAVLFLLLPIDNLYAFKKYPMIVAMVVNVVSVISYILRARKIGRNSDS